MLHHNLGELEYFLVFCLGWVILEVGVLVLRDLVLQHQLKTLGVLVDQLLQRRLVLLQVPFLQIDTIRLSASSKTPSRTDFSSQTPVKFAGCRTCSSETETSAETRSRAVSWTRRSTSAEPDLNYWHGPQAY